jgi:hypothetical protein
MRVAGLVLAGIIAIIAPIAAHANGPGSSIGPAKAGPPPGIVLAWDGGGSGGRSGPIGGHATTGHARQWNGGPGDAHRGQDRQYGAWGFYGGPAPTYWVWVPGSAVFDYPFADWRGPTGGWGNP